MSYSEDDDTIPQLFNTIPIRAKSFNKNLKNGKTEHPKKPLIIRYHQSHLLHF